MSAGALRVGLLGAGRIGRIHGGNVSAHPRARLVALADASEETARTLAQATGAEVCDLDAIIEASDIDAVLIGTPTDTHADLIERAARTGFDWPNLDQVLDKLTEELAELRAAADQEERIDEFGDVLFVIANVARWLKLDAEEALRRTNSKFARRFGGIERLARERGLTLEEMSLDEMEALYQEVKAEE